MSIMDLLFKSIATQPYNDVTHSMGNEGVPDDLHKSMRAVEPKSIIEDPNALVSRMDFKEKPQSITYETLTNMADKDSVISSIIFTRVNQVSTFSQPARYTKDNVGFEIKLRDPKAKPSKEQRQTILALETFIENCGYNYDPSRDNFDTFLRKTVRDSLVYDQLTFEIVPDRVGRPAEIHAVDASTIRAATVELEDGKQFVTPGTTNERDIQWVQIIDNVIMTEFTGQELAFAVRNPRTDIKRQPYGVSELEILIQQVTAHLCAENYNSKYFSQGGTTKGILNLKGQNINKMQLDAFRRQWLSQLAGVTGAWKTPVVSVDGLEYINVSQSNREMEYEMWMNYLINISCAVYQIDPAEINFPNRGGAGGSKGGLGEGGIEDRLKNSKDKGLRPLLRFIESTVNRYIIRRFSNQYSFNFVGLDGDSESERLEVGSRQVKTFKTINEVRIENDLEPLKNGDVVLDPTYTNYVLQKESQEQMEQQMEQGGGMEGEQPQEEEVDPQQESQDSQLSDSIDSNY